MTAVASPLRIALWSRHGVGAHYSGPGTAALRFYETGEMRRATRVTLVHGSAGRQAAAFADTVYLGPAGGRGLAAGGNRISDRAAMLGGGLQFLRNARRWIRANAGAIDLLHGLGAELLTLEPAMWAQRHGVPAVVKVTAHGNQVRVAASLRGAFLLGARRRRQLRALDAVISVSRSITGELLRAGVAASHIAEIPNGVDLGRFAPVAGPERSRRRASLGLRDIPTVVFVGALVPRKQPHLLIEAAGRLRTVTGAQLVLAGPAPDPGYLASLRRLAAETGAADLVALPGLVSNIEDYLAAADVFCLPSSREGLPNAAIEAMAAGLPLLLTPFAGAEDLGVPAEATGLLANASGPSIADALAQLLRDDALRAALGTAARRFAERRFAIDRVAGLHLELFRSLVR